MSLFNIFNRDDYTDEADLSRANSAEDQVRREKNIINSLRDEMKTLQVNGNNTASNGQSDYINQLQTEINTLKNENNAIKANHQNNDNDEINNLQNEVYELQSANKNLRSSNISSQNNLKDQISHLQNANNRLLKTIDNDKYIIDNLNHEIRQANSNVRNSFGNGESARELLRDVDNMDGWRFEKFTAKMLREIGFSNTHATRGSNDFGIDVIGDLNGKKVGIQCKDYSSGGDIGYNAVEQTVSGKEFYKLDEGVLLTNRKFTHSAKVGARRTHIKLWDRRSLLHLIILAKNNNINLENKKLQRQIKRIKETKYNRTREINSPKRNIYNYRTNPHIKPQNSFRNRYHHAYRTRNKWITDYPILYFIIMVIVSVIVYKMN